MADITPIRNVRNAHGVSETAGIWIDSELTGHLTLKSKPVESLAGDMRSLDERLKSVQLPPALSHFYIRARHFDYVGLGSSGDRLFYVEGDLRAVYESSRNEDMGVAISSIYDDSALKFEEYFLEKTEWGEAWVKVFDFDNRFIGVLRPSYVADFLNANIDVRDVDVKLKSLSAVKNKPGKYKISGDIRSTADKHTLEKIDGWFGRKTTIVHDDIKFFLDYAREVGFDIVSYAKKPEGYASPGEKTVVLPVGTPAGKNLETANKRLSHESSSGRRLIADVIAACAVVGALLGGIYASSEDGCSGCKSEYKIVNNKKMPEQTVQEEKRAQEAQPSKDSFARPEKTANKKPATDDRPIKTKPATVKPRGTVPRKVTRGKPIAKRRAAGAAERRNTGSAGTATTRETVAAPAGKSFTYLPPIREGDPFYDEFRDNIDDYLQDCVDEGGSGNEGAFILDYVTDVYGNITRARIREAVSGRPIPAKCSEGLMEIIKRQKLETSSDGLYTNKEVIDLGGK